MKEKLAIIGSLVVLIGACFGAYFYFEQRYALAEELKKVSNRLEYKIIADQFQAIQERIWKIWDRSGRNPSNSTTNEELRQLEKSKEELKDKLKSMEKSP